MSFLSYETKNEVRASEFVEYLNALGNYGHPMDPNMFFAKQDALGVEQEKIALAFVSLESQKIVRKFETLNFNVYSIKSEYNDRSFAGFTSTKLLDVYKHIVDKFNSWFGADLNITIEYLENYGPRIIFQAKTTELALRLASACVRVATNLKTATYAYEGIFLKKAHELIKTDALNGVRHLCDSYDLALTYHLKTHKFNAKNAYISKEINLNPESIQSFQHSPYQIFSVLNRAENPEQFDLLTSLYIVDMGDILCSIQNTMSSICGSTNFTQQVNLSRIELV